jgi:hypothetical protein
VHHIRRARHFIYIESQYFMGSSFLWHQDRRVGCHHIIPAEILAKIRHKIHAHERFCAYIVIPLHPQGNPVRLSRFACWCHLLESLRSTCSVGLGGQRFDWQSSPTPCVACMLPNAPTPLRQAACL